MQTVCQCCQPSSGIGCSAIHWHNGTHLCDCFDGEQLRMTGLLPGRPKWSNNNRSRDILQSLLHTCGHAVVKNGVSGNVPTPTISGLLYCRCRPTSKPRASELPIDR